MSKYLQSVFTQPEMVYKPGKSWVSFVWHLSLPYPMIPNIIVKDSQVSSQPINLHELTKPENQTS